MGSVTKLKPRAKHAPKSLAGLYDANRKRPQTVRTPPWFLEAVCEALQESVIPLDPCATKNPAWHFALENWWTHGLDRPWELKAFANPVFRYLDAWMTYAQSEAMRTGLPTVLLGPWRSHRINFCRNIKGGEVVFLKAFPFVGRKNATPFPCFAVSFHCSLPRTRYELDRRKW